MEQSGTGFSETSSDTYAFPWNNNFYRPGDNRKRIDFKVCIILPYTQNHAVLQMKEYKQSLAMPKQVLIMIPLEGKILKEVSNS